MPCHRAVAVAYAAMSALLVALPSCTANAGPGRDVGDLALVRSVMAGWVSDARPAYGAYVLFEGDFDQTPGAACKVRINHPDALTMTDQEGGPVVRLRNPSAAVPPAPGDAPGLGLEAYRRGVLTAARALRAACVDISLAPVMEPSTQFTPQRSAADRMDVVEPYARAYAEAMVEGGVVPVLKHFPGKTIWMRPAKDHPMVAKRANGEPVYTIETRPGETLSNARRFQIGFPAGIMMSNAIYEGYSDVPAVADPQWSAFLREELGFDGMVVTDALDELRLDAEVVERILPNADLFMVLDPGNAAKFESAVLDALADGRITRADLEAKRARIERHRDWVRAPR